MLIAKPERIDLGRLNVGESTEAELVLFDPNDYHITLNQVRTSCHCLSVCRVPLLIKPSGEKDLKIRYDPSSEPGFQGDLRINLIGLDPAGSTLFRVFVDLSVRPALVERVEK